MTRIEIIPGPKLFEDSVGQWEDLSADSKTGTLFQTFRWQQTWMNHYGAAKSPFAVAVYEGDDLLGLATFVKSPGLWRSLRWIGGGPSDYLQPLARTGFEQIVGEAIGQYLKEKSGVDLVDLHQVRENQPLASYFPEDEQVEQAVSLVLDLPGTFDEYLGTIGKSLRYDVRKLNKELFSRGKAVMETVTTDGIQLGFETFLEQHKARWRDRKLPGAFIGKNLRFHREWVQSAVRSGILKLKILRIDGTPAGAIYAMQHNQVLYYYQAGFDPTFKSVSPGTLLVADCIREGIEDGMERFDFMRGDEPYKRRWKPQNCYRNLRILHANGQARGRAALAWNQKAHSVEMKVRAKLEGGRLG